jgi:TonB family protein
MRIFFLLAFPLFALTSLMGQPSVQVVAEKANVRSSPSAKAEVVATVAREESLDLIESRGAWFKVKASGRVGWIHGNAVRTVNPSLILPPRYGDPKSTFSDLSSGPGTGSGIGTGRGQGVGTGSGTGQSRGSLPAAETAVPLVSGTRTTAIRILFKPNATYTDAARSNNVQGTVILKVTFLASGEIGSIVPISSLPDGLTEQAVAAAQGIKFEPKRVKGVAQTVVLPVEYSFSIY